jgi:ribosomal protein L11 methyltransferase
VRIDPGTAFGTGTHVTTRLAWELLEEALCDDREPEAVRLLDVGTGSGILSLGAITLTQRILATGTERDPWARSALLENRKSHERFEIVFTTTLPFRPGSFDLAVANLTLPEHQAVTTGLQDALAPRCRVVLSGLLENQVAEVEPAWLARGFSVTAREAREGWAALLLSRISHAPPGCRGQGQVPDRSFRSRRRGGIP